MKKKDEEAEQPVTMNEENEETEHLGTMTPTVANPAAEV